MTTPTPRQTALLDQVHASVTHARSVLTTVVDEHGGTRIPIPAWLQPHTDTLMAAVTDGTVTGCPHLWAVAQVLHAAVWAPGHIACSWCATALNPPPGEDHTCDRCRKPASRLTNGAVAVGPILLGFGICRPCLTTTRKETPR